MACTEQRGMTMRVLGSLETGHFPRLGFCPPRGTLLSYLGFPGGSAGKESSCNVGNLASIPWLEGYPLQYSGLENSMKCTVHGVAKSQTPLSDFHFHFSLSCIGEGNGNPLQYSCLENPRDGKPGGLPSMGRTESDTTEAT